MGMKFMRAKEAKCLKEVCDVDVQCVIIYTHILLLYNHNATVGQLQVEISHTNFDLHSPKFLTFFL